MINDWQIKIIDEMPLALTKIYVYRQVGDGEIEILYSNVVVKRIEKYAVNNPEPTIALPSNVIKILQKTLLGEKE